MKHIKNRTGAKSTTTTLGGTGSASTHIMARRTKNTYKVATSPNDPLGFSLNGIRRPGISVGKESLFSQNPRCCAGSGIKKIQKSVMNTKGMLATRFRWKKTPVPGYTTLQTIYNNWVSTGQGGYIETGTVGQHIESTSIKSTMCQDHKLVQPNNNRCDKVGNTRVKGATCTKSCDSRIGQKINYPRHHAKFHKLIKDSSDANVNAIRQRAGFVIDPQDLFKPFPFTVPANSCGALVADQVTNPRIMEVYYGI